MVSVDTTIKNYKIYEKNDTLYGTLHHNEYESCTKTCRERLLECS